MKGPKQYKVLVLGVDYDQIAIKKPDLLRSKLSRDRLYPEIHDFLVLGYAPKGRAGIIDTHIRYHHVRSFFQHIRPIDDFLLIFRLPFILLRHRFSPDFITTSNAGFLLPLLFIKLFTKAKLFFFVIGLPRELSWKTQSYLQYFYIFLSETFGRFLIDYAAVKSTALRDYARNYLRVPKERTTLFFNNFIETDLPLIAQADPRFVYNALPIKKGTKIIVSVGRLEPEKQFDRLVALFSEADIENTVLVILGEGRLRPQLEEFIKEKNMTDRVFLPGFVNRKNLWSYYAAADVFVLLSLSEGAAYVVFEAMYSKTPVIASPIAGVRDAIGQEERGWYLDDRCDSRSFGDLATKLFAKEDSAKKTIEKARLYVESSMSQRDSIASFFPNYAPVKNSTDSTIGLS